jgi:tRNA pseudouridine38-40 synthase
VCRDPAAGRLSSSGNVRTRKLTVAYDGSGFVGWQRQAAGDSIQGILEDALAEFDGRPVTVYGAGRTDAGVHALGQVASVRLESAIDAMTMTRALNAKLPEAIRVLKVEDAPADFHARFSATSKTYRYLIGRGDIASPFTRAFTWPLTGPLDVMAMRQAARALVGRHDFSAFRSVGSGTPDSVRTISRAEVLVIPQPPAALWGPSADVIAVELAADGFLRHMVRAITGTLVEVGRGWRSPDSMRTLTAGAARADAGATAPPHGLFLVRVDYDSGGVAGGLSTGCAEGDD